MKPKMHDVGVRRSRANREFVSDFKVSVDWGDHVVFTADDSAVLIVIPNAAKIFGSDADPGKDYLAAEIAPGGTWQTPTVKDSAGGTKEKRQAYPYAAYCGGEDGFAEKQGNSSPVMLIGPP
jgi:hypothetical protein